MGSASTALGTGGFRKTVNKLGENLRAIRKNEELTLADVAARTGLSVSFLSDAERGRAQPSLETLEKLAAYYELTVIELLKGKGMRKYAVYLPGERVVVKASSYNRDQEWIDFVDDEDTVIACFCICAVQAIIDLEYEVRP
jgi:transcriptional regulator with XRE-family HTH domain